jgi:hypothetical protein
MKKTLLTAFILSALPKMAMSQDGAFSTTTKLRGEVFVGKSLFGNGNELQTHRVYNSMSDRISEKQLYGSAGNGTVFGIGVDYFFDPCFGVGLNVSHLSGAWQQYSKDEYANGYQISEEFRGNYNNITLGVKARTCCDGDWHGEANFGPSLFPGSNTEFKEIISNNGKTSYDIQRTINNKFGIGLTGGFGGDYQINDHFNVGLNISGTMFTATGKSAIYTKYDDNGTDNLKDMKTSEIETNYVDELTQSSNINSNSNFSKDKPYDALAPKTGYNTVIGTLRTTFTF